MKYLYLLLTILLFSCSLEKQRWYETKKEWLETLMGISSYNILIDNFKEINGRFPDSLEEVYLVYKHYNPEEIGSIEYWHFIDVFNEKGRWIGYFPIYDSNDSIIISYILLSAGIDGKLDNVFDSSDKLHVDDWKQKLRLYNPDEFDGISIFSEEFDESWLYGYARRAYIEARPYNAKEEKYGNKDLLLYVHHYMLEMPEEDLQNWKNYLKSLEKE